MLQLIEKFKAETLKCRERLADYNDYLTILQKIKNKINYKDHFYLDRKTSESLHYDADRFILHTLTFYKS